MRITYRRALAALVLSITAAPALSAQGMAMDGRTTMVGGQAMYPAKDIVDNAVNSADHTTLVAAVKAAGLVETLKTKGPFTVLAPTNAAFAMLPAGAVESLLEPGNKAALTKVLTYHVIAGNFGSEAIAKAVRKGGGSVTMKTVAGEPLTFSLNGERNIVVRDAKGGTAGITIYDVRQSNGVIHVVDRVLMP